MFWSLGNERDALLIIPFLSWLSGEILEGKTFIEPYSVAGTLPMYLF